MSARRRLAQLGLLGLLLAIAILGAGYSAFERAVTARIAAIETPATGVEVRDRDGALLRAFANDDGRWRLAAGAGDVDPRYLEMLVAWEDKRFAEHGGVDPVAFVRAVSPGEFVHPAALVQNMYDPSRRGRTDETSVSVIGPLR